MDRVILHCDMNGFFASVELLDHPELRNRPMAVCGNPKNRHGIIVAKNELAKKFGIKTGDVLWEARNKCPGLVGVPPDFPRYLELSQQVQDIYSLYTDQVEPYGIDECWLDVTGSLYLFGDGPAIADQLRQEIRQKLDLTISAGVSFNKIFAKLGSDYKKPNATTVISRNNFQDLLWPLPAEDLLFVGRATKKKLAQYGIFTIGHIARAQPLLLEKLLGVQGRKLWCYAQGLDTSPVLRRDEMPAAMSVGQGITCTQDLTSKSQARDILMYLAQKISRRLREAGQLAQGLTVFWRDPLLLGQSRQVLLPQASRCAPVLVEAAMDLLEIHGPVPFCLRSLSLQAGKLILESRPSQLALWSQQEHLDKIERLEALSDQLQQRYGKPLLERGSQMLDLPVPKIYQGDFAVLPGARV